MDNIQSTTAERPISKSKDQIIKEAQRMEESLLYSSKGHFVAAHFWSRFHLVIGIPLVVLSAVLSASAFSQFDTKHLIAGVISLFVVAISSVMTFLNPNEKSRGHLNAGNNYDSLMNSIRVFWSIDCWQEESEQVLTSKLKKFAEDKSKLNQSSPQISRWAYKAARKGIKDGEGEYSVDKKQIKDF